MTVLRVLTIGGVMLFWLLKAEVDVVLEKCFEFQLVFSKPSVFNYAQNEITNSFICASPETTQVYTCACVCTHI